MLFLLCYETSYGISCEIRLKTLSKNILAIGYSCNQGQSQNFFSVLWIEDLGCLGCVEQICVSIWMRYEFRKAHNG